MSTNEQTDKFMMKSIGLSWQILGILRKIVDIWNLYLLHQVNIMIYNLNQLLLLDINIAYSFCTYMQNNVALFHIFNIALF